MAEGRGVGFQMTQISGLLALIAVIFYFAVAVLCCRAWLAARSGRDSIRPPAFHNRVWLVAGVVFFAAAISRYFGIEDDLRIWLRGGLQAEHLYKERRDFQSVIASLVIVAAALAGVGGFALMLRSGVLQRKGPSRITAIAGLACAGMVLLILLRLVSLHMMDLLLFRGPRLNWFIDIGATLITGWMAIAYVPALRRRMKR